MRGDASTIKERLSIVDIVTPYLKLEKTGANFKARCPFHNEKTASFFISPVRQSFYCFGCGAKGDIFTFVEEMEGTDFRGALKILAEKAGIELDPYQGESKTLKDNLYEALEIATLFFQEALSSHPEALAYIKERGISDDSIKKWKIGFARDEWRAIHSHLLSRGISKDIQERAGLIKQGDDKSKEPYDVFRGRIIFPLSDPLGRVIAFSGRALLPDAQPKYLNSPDTPLFTKSDVLYGLDLAKEEIRKKNYAVLVEGQLDLVLSHQGGVGNTVASSGTAFTHLHLERLRKLSPRIILAFDGDDAGEKAALKSATLALSLNMEAKISYLPKGKDPADLVRENPELWKEVLRGSTHAIEFLLDRLMEREKDKRKLGKAIQEKVLPLVSLLMSSIERAHFVTLIATRAGIREEVLWEDLRKVKSPTPTSTPEISKETVKEKLPRKTYIERRLIGILWWMELEKKEAHEELMKRVEKIVGKDYLKKLLDTLHIDREVLIFEAESHYKDEESLQVEIRELVGNLTDDLLRERLAELISQLSQAERMKEEAEVTRLTGEIQEIHKEMNALEEKRNLR
ncbi:MAG: DNA primase [Parcubacteria group bacterium]